MTPTLAEQAKLGIMQVIRGVFTRGYNWTPEVEAAIQIGWVEDADPNWMYDDRGAHRSARITPAGMVIVEDERWFCKCPTCEHGLAVDGWCSSCRGSGNRFGWIGDECGMHWTGRHPEVVPERHNRRQVDWYPPDVEVSRARR